MNFAYVTRGALTPATMEQLSVEQLLGLFKSVEDQSA